MWDCISIIKSSYSWPTRSPQFNIVMDRCWLPFLLPRVLMKLFSQGRPGVRTVLSQTWYCLSIRVVSSASLSVQSSWMRQEVSDPHQSHFCLDFQTLSTLCFPFLNSSYLSLFLYRRELILNIKINILQLYNILKIWKNIKKKLLQIWLEISSF